MSATPEAAAAGRIGVRQTAGGGEFYDTSTGAKFVPRGNNYIILAKFLDPYNGCTGMYHANFDVRVDNGCDTVFYDSAEAERQLTKMQADGYNAVRVFINERLIGKKSGGLDPAYIANFADFLTRAKKHHIYVMPTISYRPLLGGYANQNTHPEWFESFNFSYLSPDAIPGKRRYVTDFVNGLKTAGAPLDAILGYSIENELFFYANKKPLNLTTGTVTTADGRSYNMASASDKQSMMNNNTVYYINAIRTAIKQADPGGLVTVGFFPPGVDPSNRPLVTRGAIADSTADYIDLHYYLDFGSFQSMVDSFGITSNKKPIVMGEFGATKNTISSAGAAANAVKSLQAGSCGSGFDGWFYWTWNDNNQNMWNALESNEAVNNALKPALRYNPCVTTNTAPPVTTAPTRTPTPTAVIKRGDLNGDGKVDIFDYNLLVADFGKSGSNLTGDINHSGKVDIFDYNILVGNFGK